MPIYEYRCSECQQVFEEWVKQAENDDVRHNCPVCKGSAKRIISNTSFALKGAGWYTTEYGSRRSDPKESITSADDSGTTAPTATDCASSAPSGCTATGCMSTGCATPAL